MARRNSNKKNIIRRAKAPVTGYFDGMSFLWKVPETRFFLKLLIILISSMTFFYILDYFLLLFFSQNIVVSILSVYSLYFFLGFFIYILIELSIFYLKVKINQMNPEKMKILPMHQWTSNRPRKKYLAVHFFLFIISLGLTTALNFIDSYYFGKLYGDYLFIFSMIFFSFLFILYIIILTISVITIKGSMESFASRYSDKFEAKKRYYIVTFPIPFIIVFLIFLFPTTSVIIFYWSVFYFFVFIYICIIGIISLIKKNWRIGWALSQFSASYTILFTILIPYFIGNIIDIFGIFISFIALCFFFIQGTLEEKGDNLKNYYLEWKKNSSNFKNKQLEPEIRKAYPKTISSLMLLTLTMFGLFFMILPAFTVLSIQEGMTTLSLILEVLSFMENLGFIIGTVLFVIVIAIRESRTIS